MCHEKTLMNGVYVSYSISPKKDYKYARVSLMYSVDPSGLNAIPFGCFNVSSTKKTAPDVALYR